MRPQTREPSTAVGRSSRGRAALRRTLLFALPMATGAGLAINILAGIDLRLAAGGVLAVGAGCWLVVVRGLSLAARAQLRHRVRVGALAGVVATAGYDVARYGLVSLTSLTFQPFHVFPRFGALLLGPNAPMPWLYVAGIGFHLANGIGFAIGYTLLARRPSWWSAMIFAFALELCMALLYPSWLRLTALQEFLQVSILGHAIYGLVLGSITRRHAGDDPLW